MKHNLKITIILLAMFLITQLIGLWVVDFYRAGNSLPYGMQPPDDLTKDREGIGLLRHIMVAFIFAIALFFILTRIKAEKLIRAWFFVVTTIAIGLTLNVIFNKLNIASYTSFMAIILAIPFAFYKIYKRNLIVHNITELLIYPGIAAVFVPILGILGIIILLLAISLYDIWAVWKSKFMQNLAKYQINNLKFFTGFFIPYTGRKEKRKIELLRQKYLNKPEKIKERAFKKSKIKINLAILGGGDIIFPIITAGVFYVAMGIVPALIITTSAAAGLLYLFILARKGKFYPAMPFLTIAMYLGMIISWII